MALLRDAWEEYELRPIGRLKGPRGVSKPAGRALSREELDLLTQAALGHSSRYGAVVLVLAYTGLRPKEVVMLRRTDLDLADPDNAWIKVGHSKTKKGAGRRLPLPGVAVEALARHIQDSPESPWLFPMLKEPHRPCGTFIATSSVARSSALAGVEDVSPYDLRRTYATMLEQVGVSRSVMRELAGHTRDTTTDLYVRPTDQDKRRALTLIEGGRLPSKTA